MQTKLIRKATLAFLLLSSLITTVSHAANWYVKTTGTDAPGNGTSLNPFRTITYAVSKAIDGDVIFVGTGTFTEQVEIAKNLTITGEGSAATVIAAPSTMPLSFYRDIQYIPVVFVHDANVTLKNLAVDGNTFQNSTAAFVGVAFNQAGGQADNIKVSTAANLAAYSNRFGYGFLANADNGTARSITLSNSSITSVQKFAIGFLGKDLTATADANTVIGAGKTAAFAQNGILISNQATGTVKNNIVKNFLYAGPDFTAIGIYAVDARPTITITANQLTDCQTGIFCININGTQVGQNKIVFNAYTYDSAINYSWGILVENGTYSVTFNEIDGGGAGTGVDAFAVGNNEKTTASILNNIVKNVETGVSFEVDDDPACATGEAHNNSITNATEPIYYSQYANSLLYQSSCPPPDFSCNWYGSVYELDFVAKFKFVNYDPSNPPNYKPWLSSGTDAKPADLGFQPSAPCTGAIGNYGCTLGYWKNAADLSWDLAGYKRNTDLFMTVFQIAANKTQGVVTASTTLQQALSTGGGGFKNLTRQSVAALLNTARGFYPYLKEDIIKAVSSMFNNGTASFPQMVVGSKTYAAKTFTDVDKMATYIDALNNQNCPLNNHGYFEISSATRSQDLQAGEVLVDNAYTVKAFPNPSTKDFELQITGAFTDKVDIRVIDVMGRLVEQRQNLPVNQAVKIGSAYAPGIYCVQVLLGNEKKQVKLVKL